MSRRSGRRIELEAGRSHVFEATARANLLEALAEVLTILPEDSAVVAVRRHHCGSWRGGIFRQCLALCIGAGRSGSVLGAGSLAQSRQYCRYTCRHKKSFRKPRRLRYLTAFHQTLPRHAYLYAVPYESVHGDMACAVMDSMAPDHRYVAGETARRLGKELSELCVVIAHLGNGCSACAVEAGQSVDTTMGLSPLEGLVMGTRSGDIDPSHA